MPTKTPQISFPRFDPLNDASPNASASASVSVSAPNATSQNGVAQSSEVIVALVGAPETALSAVEVEERHAQHLLDKAFALWEKNDVAGAIVACRQAIHLKPRSASAYSMLGLLLERASDATGAIAAYEKAVALEPASLLERDSARRLRAERRPNAAAIFHFQDDDLFDTAREPQSPASATNANSTLSNAVAPISANEINAPLNETPTFAQSTTPTPHVPTPHVPTPASSVDALQNMSATSTSQPECVATTISSTRTDAAPAPTSISPNSGTPNRDTGSARAVILPPISGNNLTISPNANVTNAAATNAAATNAATISINGARPISPQPIATAPFANGARELATNSARSSAGFFSDLSQRWRTQPSFRRLCWTMSALGLVAFSLLFWSRHATGNENGANVSSRVETETSSNVVQNDARDKTAQNGGANSVSNLTSHVANAPTNAVATSSTQIANNGQQTTVNSPVQNGASASAATTHGAPSNGATNSAATRDLNPNNSAPVNAQANSAQATNAPIAASGWVVSNGPAPAPLRASNVAVGLGSRRNAVRAVHSERAAPARSESRRERFAPRARRSSDVVQRVRETPRFLAPSLPDVRADVRTVAPANVSRLPRVAENPGAAESRNEASPNDIARSSSGNPAAAGDLPSFPSPVRTNSQNEMRAADSENTP